MLQFDGVYKHFRKFLCKLSVLEDISFELCSGKCMAVVGENGSGKSTLIKLALGLQQPSSGIVRCMSLKMPNQKSLSGIGYVPEDNYLHGFLSVRETILFSASLQGLKLSEKELYPLLDKVGLSGREETKISACSKGMRRRTLWACALVHSPKLLILDEPTSGLDENGVKIFVKFIEEYKKTGGSILLSTHYLSFFIHVVDDCLTLHV